MISRWLLVGSLAALVIMTGATGVSSYLYARQASELETAQANNKLLSEALDRVINQRKVDDRSVTDLTNAVRSLSEALDEQEEALRALAANDPESKEFLNRPVPDSVRKLFPNK